MVGHLVSSVLGLVLGARQVCLGFVFYFYGGRHGFGVWEGGG